MIVTSVSVVILIVDEFHIALQELMIATRPYRVALRDTIPEPP